MIIKHIMRLKNTIVRHWKILKLKLEYGKKIDVKKFHFREGFHVYLEEKGVLKIGKNCFFNNNCSITVRDSVVIGDNCIFGENVKIYDHNHSYLDMNFPISQQGFSVAKIIVENDCWIGSNAVILKGVHIGSHCVIGAGVIVYKDVPDNTLVLCKQELHYIDLIK